MKEFSGLMRAEIEVIIEAKNKEEAEKIFEDIYPSISIEKEGSQKIKILDERNNLDCIEWEISEIG
jgi:hypothetical protein